MQEEIMCIKLSITEYVNIMLQTHHNPDLHPSCAFKCEGLVTPRQLFFSYQS
jgi:hypothetical protein